MEPIAGGLHPLLAEQLRDSGIDAGAGTPLQALLHRVSEAYVKNDAAHKNELGVAAKILPILKADVAGSVTEWNAQLASSSGVPATEVVGRTLITLVQSNGREAVVRALAKALQGQVTRDVNVAFVLDRSWHLRLSLGISPRYDTRGRIVGIFALAQVLSPLSPPTMAPSAESADDGSIGGSSSGSGHATALQAVLLQGVVQAANVPLVSVDPLGRVVLWNQRMESMTGLEAAQVLGTPLWQAPPFAQAETATLTRSMLDRALGGEHVIGVDLTLRTSRGAGAGLQLNASPIQSQSQSGGSDSSGAANVAASGSGRAGVDGVVLVGVPDTSEQRGVEQTQLARSWLPERPGKGGRKGGGPPRIDLATLSHELRTPLNGLLGSLELALQQQPMIPAIRVPLRHAMTSGNHLLDLVNDLLALHGTVELERQRFNLREALEKHGEECGSHAKEQSVTFAQTVDPRVPKHVLGDRRRLLQVINHLTANALRSTKRGSISVNVDVLREDEGVVTLRLVVRDTGVGMQQQELDDATRSLLTNDDESKGVEWRTTWRTQRASGRTAALGIAICHQLLASMGGTIVVKSAYGEGSRVEATCTLEKTYSNTVIERRRSHEMVLADAGAASAGAMAAAADDKEAKVKSSSEADDEEECGGPLSAVPSSTSSKAAHERGTAESSTDDRRSAKSDETIEVGYFAAANRERSMDGLAACGESGVAAPPSPEVVDQRLEVLVVEDNELNAWVVCNMLQGRGHRVRHVQDGSAAVELVAHTLKRADLARIDLILMDCSMPLIDGYTATALIRYRVEASARAVHGLPPTFDACHPPSTLPCTATLPQVPRGGARRRLAQLLVLWQGRADHRAHRLCDGRRPRQVPRGRHGRLPDKAGGQVVAPQAHRPLPARALRRHRVVASHLAAARRRQQATHRERLEALPALPAELPRAPLRDGLLAAPRGEPRPQRRRRRRGRAGGAALRAARAPRGTHAERAHRPAHFRRGGGELGWHGRTARLARASTTHGGGRAHHHARRHAGVAQRREPSA